MCIISTQDGVILQGHTLCTQTNNGGRMSRSHEGSTTKND